MTLKRVKAAKYSTVVPVMQPYIHMTGSYAAVMQIALGFIPSKFDLISPLLLGFHKNDSIIWTHLWDHIHCHHIPPLSGSRQKQWCGNSNRARIKHRVKLRSERGHFYIQSTVLYDIVRKRFAHFHIVKVLRLHCEVTLVTIGVHLYFHTISI